MVAGRARGGRGRDAIARTASVAPSDRLVSASSDTVSACQFVALFHRPPLSWWDVVDILIVSVLIYEALKLIRGTRAMQMAIGSAARAAAVLRLAAFPLQTVNWLIRNLLAYVVFAAIVLFQSDIRRALSHLGRAPFFRYLGRSEQCGRDDRRSRHRRRHAREGARRRDHRRSSARSACATTSRAAFRSTPTVSYDLLTTIFQPTTPLHDGAVIISEERDRGGGVLPAADGESEARSRSRHAPSRGHRPDRGVATPSP